MRKALITGITGQDGSYLADFLVAKGYEVHGLVRRSSVPERARIEHLLPFTPGVQREVHLHYGDLATSGLLLQLLTDIRPDEIYNLGAQSHVKLSFDLAEYTCDVAALGPLRVLEAIKASGLARKSRYYQASTAEIFGNGEGAPQSELCSLNPTSPYACAKAFGYFITLNYRRSYGMHASNGIMFNHESPRRGETFVSRKITRAAARIKLGLQTELLLGNLDAKRDWGYAKEYVEAMWLMLQQEEPNDYVIATGETHSVRDFCREAFRIVGLDWEAHVRHDPRYDRPAEVMNLHGDASRARRILGWEPKVRFNELVRIMVDHDIKLARNEMLIATKRESPEKNVRTTI